MTSPRIDLTKHITPVITHDGRILARFSDRATAVRMASAWGGCVVGRTHPDAGRTTPERAGKWAPRVELAMFLGTYCRTPLFAFPAR